MKKTITLNVPNELWVDDFSQNKTASFEYDGPDVLWLTHTEDGQLLGFVTEEPEGALSIKVEIASATNEEIAAAIIATTASVNHQYTYEDELNHDGSIYKKITNPRVADYFIAQLLVNQITLKVSVKDTKHINLDKALQRKNYVAKYKNAYSFSVEEQAQIDTFMADITAYIDTIKTAYPWKFIEVNEEEIPKIAVNLVKLFNELPDPAISQGA